MREIVELLRESGSVDELGLGRIRDTFSDRLFPGTSVLWRRARYLLFVAWIYRVLEEEGFRQADAERAARRLQRDIRDAILNSGDTDGLIGMRTPDPVSPPDVILWAALGGWGVREPGVGTLARYRSTLPARPNRSHDLEPGAAPDPVWNPGLPTVPHGFPGNATFALTTREALFLRDLALAEDADPGTDTTAAGRKDSLFADLLRAEVLHDVKAPWQHPVTKAASADLKDALDHSGCFSDVMHGATLLYARTLADLRQQEPQRDAADKALSKWAGRITEDRARLDAWGSNLDDFFGLLGRTMGVHASERAFVTQWTTFVLRDPAALTSSRDARLLVQDREAQAKGGKARLTAPRDKDRGDGGAIPGQMTFRWGNARQIVQDIRDGLGT